MVFSLILASGAFALIAWLVFNFSVHALPFFVGVSAASLAHRTGAGLLGSAIVGLIAGAVTFGVGQAAFGMARSAIARASVAAIFAIPAAVAGYYSTLGIVALCVPGAGWRQAFSVVGGIVIGSVAFRHLAAFAPLREAEPGRTASIVPSAPVGLRRPPRCRGERSWRRLSGQQAKGPACAPCKRLSRAASAEPSQIAVADWVGIVSPGS